MLENNEKNIKISKQVNLLIDTAVFYGKDVHQY